MLSDRRISEAIGMIYDCVPDPTGWSGALEKMCEIAEGAVGTLAVLDTHQRSARFAAVCGDAEATSALMQKYAAHMPLYHVLHLLDVDRPYTVPEVVSYLGSGQEHIWYESPTYTEWATTFRLRNGFCMNLMKQPGRIASLNLVTHDDRRPIDHDDKALVSLLSPHVRRAVSISDLFERERETVGFFRMLIDRLARPVVIVTDAMKILHANPAAEEFLSQGPAVRSLRGELTVNWPTAHQALQHAVRMGARDEVQLAALGINMPLARMDKPCIAHVFPLARRQNAFSVGSSAAAAIFISSAGDENQMAIDAVAALFGLTWAERGVVAQATHGRSRLEIAEFTGVRPSTVKTQLEAAYAKMGVKNQPQLMALMAELSLPLRD